MNKTNCSTCFFNIEDVRCDAGNQYFYAEFGQGCPDYKTIHTEDANRNPKDQRPEVEGHIPDKG